MGSAVYDATTNTSMILWGECLEACAGQHGNPRRSNETVWSAPTFMVTRSTDHFATWTHENVTATNDPETFPINTYSLPPPPTAHNCTRAHAHTHTPALAPARLLSASSSASGCACVCACVPARARANWVAARMHEEM